MRVVGEIPSPDCKITVFFWNNRYLLKFEKGYLEQTYKINQYDVVDENDLRGMVNQNFVDQVLKLFEGMEKLLHNALQGL